MKLRNKKTGEILCALLGSYPVSGDATIEFMDENSESGYSVYARYSTLAELNEEWEDYKPAKPEPLIKDEKVRKAVRAWAEANDYSLVKIGYDMASEPNYGNVQIHFEDVDIVDEEKYGVHTIAELCGEEEE